MTPINYDKYKGHTKRISVSGMRGKMGGQPVLRLINEVDEVIGFVLYGDGSNEQHAQAYAEAHLFADSPLILQRCMELEEAIKKVSLIAGTLYPQDQVMTNVCKKVLSRAEE